MVQPSPHEVPRDPVPTLRVEPGAGQESVWDYPKPPRYEPVASHVRVAFGGAVVAETRRAVRALQTGIPPVYYIPSEDVRTEFLIPIERRSHCPYKGDATYWTVRVGEREATGAAWSYPTPLPEASAIAGHLAFYAHVMDACTVDGQPARSPDWQWIGGWVTAEIVGPFVQPEQIPGVRHLQHQP